MQLRTQVGIIGAGPAGLLLEDEPTNASDPVLQRVPADRRPTLLARRVADEELVGKLVVYRFDIVLQGVGETAFFQL